MVNIRPGPGGAIAIKTPSQRCLKGLHRSSNERIRVSCSSIIVTIFLCEVPILEKECEGRENGCKIDLYSVVGGHGSDQFYSLGCIFTPSPLGRAVATEEINKGVGWSKIDTCGTDYCNSFASHPEESSRDSGIYRDNQASPPAPWDP